MSSSEFWRMEHGRERLRVRCRAARASDIEFDALFESHIAPIEGVLTCGEARRLFHLACNLQSGAIMQVSEYPGRPAAALIYGSLAGNERPVFIVDNEMAARKRSERKSCVKDRATLYRTILTSDVSSIVRVINVSSKAISPGWELPLALVVIDGVQDYESVRRDVFCWMPHLQSGARIVFCDVREPRFTCLVNELSDAGWTAEDSRNCSLQVIRASDSLRDLFRVSSRLPTSGSVCPFEFIANWVSPEELLVPNRFDFSAKHIYARFREQGTNCKWGRFVYTFHLLIWNSFIEFAPAKHSEVDFLRCFDRIIEDTRLATDQGLHSIIPLAMNGWPLNGAHRIVAALLLGKKVSVTKIDAYPSYVEWSYKFFRKNAALAGHPESGDVLDSMAMEFCRILPRFAIAIRFFTAVGFDDELEEVLSLHVRLFYKKEVHLEKDGGIHLMHFIRGSNWDSAVTDGDIESRRLNTEIAFLCPESVTFFLLSFDNEEELTDARVRAGELFADSRQNAVCITKTHAESLHVAQLAFSDQSIQFACSRSWREVANFGKLFEVYRDRCACFENADDRCIVGRAVMAVYGICDCDCIEYIAHPGQSNASSSLFIDFTSDWEVICKTPADEVIFNPCNYFYFQGMKFATLGLVRDLMRARGEPHDDIDVGLIDAWVMFQEPPPKGG